MPVELDLSKLTFYEGAVMSGSEAAIELGAHVAYETAVRLCPVDTGSLQASIQVDTDADGAVVVTAGDPTAINPKTGGPVDYAAPVEYGSDHDSVGGHTTRPFHIPAQPFMRPGYEAGKAAALEAGAHVLDSSAGSTPLERSMNRGLGR